MSVHSDAGGLNFVGVEEPVNKLVNLLAFEDRSQKQLKMVSILGFAGVGKTTVAMTLYHNFRGKFQCRAFLRASRTPDMMGILTSILLQIKAPQVHGFPDAQDLIDNIREHLQSKRYFIIIDDLWTTSVWNIISCAFPDNDCCSRIVTTTETEDASLACCSYDSTYIFQMSPLNDDQSGKLFFSRVFGSEDGCPPEFREVSYGIIRKCGGSPLATVIIASMLAWEPNLAMEKWKHIHDSLPSIMSTNLTSEGMKEVLNLIYNYLPPHLKTCLLHLGVYPEGYMIWKDDLVKQWVAEGFLGTMEEGQNMEKTGGAYFDELVSRGMIQVVDTNDSGEVLRCTLHQMVLDFIKDKSMEDNFAITVDYSQSTLALLDKVRRLSVQFGGAKRAEIPEGIIMSQVRSLLFFGFFKCAPLILGYGVLRVLILHIWADEDKIIDLSRISELCRLTYLNIKCNITIKLPAKIRGIQDLETLEVDARLSAVPSDIVHLEKLLHLRLPSESYLPHGVALSEPWGEKTSGFIGVIVSDPWLQGQFTQVELRSLKAKFMSLKRDSGQIEFESFLRVYLNLQEMVGAQRRSVGSSKYSLGFVKSSTTKLLHIVNQAEKSSYVAHINTYLREDPFLKKYLPIDPSGNQLFDLIRDGVVLCKLINVAVPGTIDERAINKKRVLNPWERNENHTLCLNSAKAIGCTVVNIGTQDLVEGRPHLVLGLISQIIKIQLLADLNLKKTPQLFELFDDSKDIDEVLSWSPEKLLLKWMNHHLKKAGYKKTVNNFSSDVKDGEAYAYLLKALAPETSPETTMETKDPDERAKMILDQAEKLDCKRYLTPKDITEGSANLNLAFVAQIFHHRNGLTSDVKQVTLTQTATRDDILVSREERAFRMWINSLGVESYVNNVFEDVRNGWVLLEVLDKVSPGSVNWKLASKPPIKMPFRKLENCNQVIKIGKELKFSLVNLAGNDIVQGNKKLIVALLWQLMRFNILQLLNRLRSHSQGSQGKQITDADILNWANNKVKASGRTSRIESFKDKSLSNGVFFLELLSAVQPRVVNWKVVTKGEADDEKKQNATYIISVARNLGCSVFLLPEDIIEVNQKMILTLTASIMYWSLQRTPLSQSDMSEPSEPSSMASDVASDIGSEDGASTAAPSECEEVNSLSDGMSNLTTDDATSNAPPAENGNGEAGS